MRGWRPALRLAWRDAVRARGRSILVLVMIALPVLAVTAAAVVQATADVDSVDSIPRTMGSAEARIQPVGGRIIQAPDPESGMWTNQGSGEEPTLDELAPVLGDRDVITIAQSYTEILLGQRRIEVLPTEVDLRNPMTEGLFDLRTGELPSAPGEAVINEALAERGVAVGDTLEVYGEAITVVGIGRDASHRGSPTVTVPPGTFGDDFSQVTPDWLVDGAALSWSDVRAINALGGLVTSRAVLLDPPPVVQMAEEMGIDTGFGDYVAIVALIITMALLEVVLLAGPAFAVSARRQARTLALMAACGGTPRQARRVVLASGIVLGLAAALAGAVLGVLLGIALVPVAQTFSAAWFGPLDVNWIIVLVVAAFGLLSAFLAVVVPAWLASRQDVVAVLAGRRGDAPPSARTPIVGLVLLGIGVALSVAGAARVSFLFFNAGSYAIALGAVISVLGMIFIVPLVVAGIARLSRPLPLVMRYAARDAARHRTRTVPAVAAVAATVAGVVALGIGNAGDEAGNRETYKPTLAMGAATVGVYAEFDYVAGDAEVPSDDVWDRVDAAIAERAPGARSEVIMGQRQERADGSTYSFELTRADGDPVYGSWGGGPSGAATYVSDGPVPSLLNVPESRRESVETALAAGKAVVFTEGSTDGDEVVAVKTVWAADAERPVRTRLTFPALFVPATSGTMPVQLVLPTALAEAVDEPVVKVGYYFDDVGLSDEEEQDLTETLGGIAQGASLYVERGYQAPDETFILLLVLFTLGGVLMLGGTLTATFLALSDARPDLATLAAVGAAPRSRRGVAASYALVVGFVGAVLGAVVGFVPGVAITYPLTTISQGYCEPVDAGPLICKTTGPFLDIPWLLILGLVLLLPLLTALIVGAFARSRLPLAARLT